MAELLFPVSALALTFLIIVPALTGVSRVLLAKRRATTSHWASFGSDTVFALLVAPVLVPVAWLLSSALHEVEPTRALASCWILHGSTAACVDAALLVAALLTGIVGAATLRARRERAQTPNLVSSEHRDLEGRVAAIVNQTPSLRRLRTQVVSHCASPAYTLGLLRPRVILDACFVRAADDEMLRATLLHEFAHVAAYDNARSFLVRLCLTLNPARAWLQADYGRWRSAREAHCDGDAVSLGGEPLALAQSILAAARFECAGLRLSGASMLCGHNAAEIKLRLALLLDGRHEHRKTAGHLFLFVLLAAALTVPHIGGLGMLEHLHFGVERLIHTH